MASNAPTPSNASPQLGGDLLFSSVMERMTQSGWVPPGSQTNGAPAPNAPQATPGLGVPGPFGAQVAVAPPAVGRPSSAAVSQSVPMVEPASNPSSPSVPPSARGMFAGPSAVPKTAAGGGTNKAVLFAVGAAVVLLIGVVAGASFVSARSNGTAGGQTQEDGSGQVNAPAADSSGADESTAVGTLSDQESYAALMASWNTFSELNNAYGAPQEGDTVPVSGWLRDEFGPKITASEGARRQMAGEAAEYAGKFASAKADLEALNVSQTYAEDQRQLLNLYDIACRRSDAYRQIADDAISNDINHWRALQKSLGTKGMRDELLSALGSYSPPVAP